MEPLDLNSPEAIEAQARVGRLWDMPLATLRPLRQSIDDPWAAAPPWLCVLARQPQDAVAGLLWKHVGHDFPVEAVPRVPVWIADVEEGYVLDFLLPQFSVGVVIDREDPEAEAVGDEWIAMQADLASVGIEPLSYYAAVVREDPADVATDIRYELGLFDN